MTLLIPLQPIVLAPGSDRIVTAEVPLAPQTATVEVRLQRPTMATTPAWDEAGTVEVTIVVTHEGVEYRRTGKATGGIRPGPDGSGIPETIMRYTLPWGFFGGREGLPKRLGETAHTTYTARVEMRRIRGSIASTLQATSEEAPAPAVAFHSSVAFDVAASTEEIAGDGDISWTHTAGGSNRAVLVETAHYNTVGTLHNDITYGGGAMTAELWDAVSGVTVDFCHQAAYLINPAASAQTAAVSVLAGFNPDYQAGGSISMTGVHQTTAVGTAVTQSGAASPATVNASDAASGDLVIDNMITFTNSAGSVAVGSANQTERNAQDWAPGNIAWWRQSEQDGANGGVMSWTITNILAVGWLTGAVAFKPAAAGGSVVTPRLLGLLGVGAG